MGLSSPTTDYIDDYEDVEAVLTQSEHRLMIDMGYVDTPDKEG